MLTKREYDRLSARVAKGAKWLDKEHKGWAQKIDLSTLNLSSGTSCVLGQCFDSFWHAIDDLRLLTFRQSCSRGFCLTEREESHFRASALWSALTELWIVRIKRRQRGAKGGVQ